MLRFIEEEPLSSVLYRFKEYQLAKLKTFNLLPWSSFANPLMSSAAKINERIVLAETKQKELQSGKQKEQNNDHDNDQNGSGAVDEIQTDETKTEAPEAKVNQGTLILNATCTPADMRFPTDLGLLNDARGKLDEIIDALHQAYGKTERRPRMYREKREKRLSDCFQTT